MQKNYPKCGLKPVSPGEILFEEFLRPLEVTQKKLAEHIRCDYKVINRIVNEKTRVSPDIALKLASAFETTPTFWLNAQTALDLWQAKSRKRKIPSLLKKKKSSRR